MEKNMENPQWMDDAPRIIAGNIATLASEAANVHRCNIHISELLPRNDGKNKLAMEINRLLRAFVERNHLNMTIINHKNISFRDLHDAKHLSYSSNRRGRELSGSQLFASNVCQAITGRMPNEQVLGNIFREWNA